MPLPGRALRIALTLLLTGVTLLSFRTLNGLSAGSALLIVMGAVKLFETRSRRDARIIAGVALFLLLAACLGSQSLPRLPLYLAETWITCAAFAALGGNRESASPRIALTAAGRTLLLALPLAVLAFLFFPRLPGPLWSLPGSERTQTGLGDEMSPGSISELSLSDAPAFRVRFEGSTPPPAVRYWRGPVLHSFDGYTWRQLPGELTARPELQYLGEPLRYHVLMEPHGRRWWYALDTVRRSPASDVFLTYDSQLLAARPVNEVTGFDAVSHTRTLTTQPLSAGGRRLDLRLPQGRNPRSVALATQLRARAADDAQFADLTLAYFRDGGFQYSLTPPLLDQNSIDDLLFNTRLGFCGHFASAYVMLMRAGGVPARVVTGYLGGEWNRIGGYLLVRQADAHAWAEIWLEGRGWTRVDPTAVVAPERLNSGMSELLRGGAGSARLLRRSAFLDGLFQAWDASNAWWQGSVVDFNLQAQLGLLDFLGMPDADYQDLVVLLGAGAALWIALLMWRLRQRSTRPEGDDLARYWRLLRERLAKRGLELHDWDGPMQLAGKAAAGFPGLELPLHEVAQRYARLRYGAVTPDDAAQRLAFSAAMKPLLKALRRQTLLAEVPRPVHDQLVELAPLYARLPAGLQRRCWREALRLRDRVHFVGCGGLELTDIHCNVIAIQAALLVVERSIELYSPLRSVLVYPDEFVVAQRVEDEDGVVTESTDVLAGQTIDTARILLSWVDVQAAGRTPDGYNVVLHEFAHLLDHVLDGRLTQLQSQLDAQWHDLFEAEFELLCDAVDRDEATLIDPYGSEDRAEFFAVCTEVFFERPKAMALRHAGLYAALQRFYRLDPAGWPGGS